MKDNDMNNSFNETAFKYMTKAQGEYTIDDLENFPEDSYVELIDGVLYVYRKTGSTHRNCHHVQYRLS